MSEEMQQSVDESTGERQPAEGPPARPAATSPGADAPTSPAADDDAPEPDSRIRRANAQAARYRVERNAARQELESLQSQLAELQTQLQAAEQTAAGERLNHLRLRTGVEVGLPPELAARLQGADAETLRQDAQQLLAALQPGDRAPLFRGGNGAAGSGRRARQIVDRIGGASHNIFDPSVQQQAGGGIIMPDEEG